MEAGQKISDNLGLPERVNKINEKVATPSVLVPAAFLGGAALALGTIGGAYAINRNTNGTAAQVIINQCLHCDKGFDNYYGMLSLVCSSSSKILGCNL